MQPYAGIHHIAKTAVLILISALEKSQEIGPRSTLQA